MRFIYAIALCTLTTTASAAEYMHCYLRDAPSDAPVSSEYNVSALLHNAMIAEVRYACGSPVDTELGVLKAIVAAGHCSPDSEIAGFVREGFDMPAEEIRAGLVAESSAKKVDSLCEIALACEAANEGYPEQCADDIFTALE